MPTGEILYFHQAKQKQLIEKQAIKQIGSLQASDKNDISNLELIIKQIWNEVLGIDDASLDDNFFEIGGDSILTIQLASKARDKGIALDVRQIFKTPTIAGLLSVLNKENQSAKRDISQSKQNISSQVMDVLARALGEKRKQVESVYRLAPMQLGLLMRELRYHQKSDLYIRHLILKFSGPLQVENMKRSWQEIVEKYDILRTGFLWKGLPEPMQYVLKNVGIYFDFDELGTSSNDIPMYLKQISLNNAKKISLNDVPIMRFTLLQVTNECFYLVFSFHHILLDGWCLNILLTELKHNYQSLTQNRILEKKKAKPFQDYINWLAQNNVDSATTFWKKYLIDMPMDCYLSSKRHPVLSESSSYGHYELILSEHETSTLLSLAKKYRVTLNIIMQCCWAIFISKYTGQEKVIFGVTISGRAINFPNIENMLGIFINTLPILIEINDNVDFSQLVNSVQNDMVDIQQYAYVSLAYIQNALSLNTSANIFETLFIFENYPTSNSQSLSKNLRMETVSHVILEKTEYPMTLGIVPGNNICCNFDYLESHFSQHEIEKIADYFLNIIRYLIRA